MCLSAAHGGSSLCPTQPVYASSFMTPAGHLLGSMHYPTCDAERCEAAVAVLRTQLEAVLGLWARPSEHGAPHGGWSPRQLSLGSAGCQMARSHLCAVCVGRRGTLLLPGGAGAGRAVCPQQPPPAKELDQAEARSFLHSPTWMLGQKNLTHLLLLFQGAGQEVKQLGPKPLLGCWHHR